MAEHEEEPEPKKKGKAKAKAKAEPEIEVLNPGVKMKVSTLRPTKRKSLID